MLMASLTSSYETAGHQGKFSDAGTHENHLALSLGCSGDDQIIPSQMLR
jgi:hypothetical protein